MKALFNTSATLPTSVHCKCNFPSEASKLKPSDPCPKRTVGTRRCCWIFVRLRAYVPCFSYLNLGLRTPPVSRSLRLYKEATLYPALVGSGGSGPTVHMNKKPRTEQMPKPCPQSFGPNPAPEPVRANVIYRTNTFVVKGTPVTYRAAFFLPRNAGKLYGRPGRLNLIKKPGILMTSISLINSY